MRPAQLIAQPIPTVEVAAGAGPEAAAEQFPSTIPVSWLASVAWKLGNDFALVGEVTGQPPARHLISTYDVYTFTVPCWAVPATGPVAPTCGADGTVQTTRQGLGERQVELYAFLIGPRFIWRSARLQPFVHLLFGMARVTWTATLEELPPGTVHAGRGAIGDLDATAGPFASETNSAAFQLGAGFDIPLGKRLKVRLAADKRQLLRERLFTSQFRLSAQLALALGTL
jgi:hypothetical protein